MKSKDKSNKKGHENTIGKIIYGFLLFMPLLAIAVTCAYVIFNKNAYQSYSGEREPESEVINYSLNQLETNGNYNLQTSLYNNTPESNVIGLMYVNNVLLENDNTDLSSVTQMRFVNYTTGITTIQLRDSNATTLKTLTISSSVYNLSFDFISTLDTNVFNLSCFNYYRISYNQNYYADNVFYYSIDKVEQSPLFSWSKDSLIYTGMNETCQALDISNTFIPMILSYWLIMSVIYFLYDIILIILHVFHRKIHQLEESI